MVMVLLVCAVGALIAWAIGPGMERLLFAPPAGVAQDVPVDIRRWLSSEYGQAWPGWFVVLVAPVALVLTVLQSMFLGRRLDRAVSGQSDVAIAGIMLVRFVAMLGLVLALSLGLAHLLQSLGFDPRNSIFGPFSPRNTLVVSMIMGFAVIPIIYTISEDSLRAVPDSLRTASLGSGATPWQTAVRIVIPVAGSGIFSACMIGLRPRGWGDDDRAHGDGQHAGDQRNIFGGFRTLSANIAVELPEAPRGRTHYRVLFLCGLVLFVMTLRVINTTAELVRQRYRKRSRAVSTAGVPKTSPGSGARATPPGRRRMSPATSATPWADGGAALSLALLLIASLSLTIGARGLTTFWPGPIDRVDTLAGRLSRRTGGDERVEPSDARRATDGRARRGRRGKDRADAVSRWQPRFGPAAVPVVPDQVEEIDQPGVRRSCERDEWGVFLGIPRAVIVRSESGARERLAEGPEETIAWLEDGLEEAAARAPAIEHLNDTAVPRIDSRHRAAPLAGARGGASGREGRRSTRPSWGVACSPCVAGAGGDVLGALVLGRMRGANGRAKERGRGGGALGHRGGGSGARGGAGAPWAGMPRHPRLGSRTVRAASPRSGRSLRRSATTCCASIRELREEDERFGWSSRIRGRAGSRPHRRARAGFPMRRRQAQRVVLSNQLVSGARRRTYLGLVVVSGPVGPARRTRRAACGPRCSGRWCSRCC